MIFFVNIEIWLPQVQKPTKQDLLHHVCNAKLPGYNIQYPANDIGKLYKEILDSDGVLFQKSDVAEATAKGSYRKLFQRARDASLQIVNESKDSEAGDEDLVIVDAAKLSFELDSGSYATMFLRELMVSTMARDSRVKSKA